MNPDDFCNRLETVRNRIQAACQRSGRTAHEVRLVAVTKTQSPEVVAMAQDCGALDIGENKVQEARAKLEVLGKRRGTWHLIGRLQSNKVKHAVAAFDWVHSVESLELATALQRHAQEQARHLRVLLQVNVSGEGSKQGLQPEEVAAVATAVNDCSHLELCGLMTIAPLAVEPEKTRPVFAALRELRDAVQLETGLVLPELSMGMSGDFEVAIEEGATLIRLGSTLFGARQ